MQAAILTPLPSTRLFEQMRHRIWTSALGALRLQVGGVRTGPDDEQDMMAGLEWINKRFYSPGHPRPSGPLAVHLMMGCKESSILPRR